jgi:hypothetical protein
MASALLDRSVQRYRGTLGSWGCDFTVVELRLNRAQHLLIQQMRPPYGMRMTILTAHESDTGVVAK